MIHLFQHDHKDGEVSRGSPDRQEEAEGKETGDESVAAEATDEANSADNADAGGGCPGALQLLRRERKLQADTEILEVSEVETYRMLNRCDQKGKLRYPKFLRIWNYYIEKPKLKVDIWGWNPKTV